MSDIKKVGVLAGKPADATGYRQGETDGAHSSLLKRGGQR